MLMQIMLSTAALLAQHVRAYGTVSVLCALGMHTDKFCIKGNTGCRHGCMVFWQHGFKFNIKHRRL